MGEEGFDRYTRQLLLKRRNLKTKSAVTKFKGLYVMISSP